jgi:hypothetical protein
MPEEKQDEVIERIVERDSQGIALIWNSTDF